jgi:AI-2 transport protein TqsA
LSDRLREQWMLITASLVVLAAVAIAFILWFTRGVMIPFVLAVFVVAVVAPLADFLEMRWRFRRWMSTVLLMVLVVSAAFLLLLTYTAGEVATAVGTYAARAYDFVNEMLDAEKDSVFSAEIQHSTERSSELQQPAEETPELKRDIPDQNNLPPSGLRGLFHVDLDTLRDEIQPLVKGSILWGIRATQNFVGSLIGILSTFFLMVVFVMFLLAAREAKRLQNPTYAEVESKIRGYIAMKTVISAVTGLLVAGILSLFGLQLAVVFGVLAFLLNFIPSIGSIIATLLPLPIAYGQFVATAAEPSWWMMLWVVAIPGLVQIVIGNVVEPRIMGEGVGLHPIAILFALAFWSLLWGPVGAILAVPITAVVKIAISRFESLGLVTNALSGRLSVVKLA